MARKREMDNLAKDAAAALAACMSYGRWKAMQWEPVKVEPKKDDLPEGWKRCLWCNAPFKPKPNQKYCGYYCQRMAQDDAERQKKNG